jgi:hypothetical protein
MCGYASCFDSGLIYLILKSFGLIVLSILFIQSGLDKISDRKGNLEWLKGHFANSPFKNSVPFVLTVLTLEEVLTGVLCLAGLGVLLITGHTAIAIIGLSSGLLTFVSLFLGQRLAKDYAGAASLIPYMIFNALVLFLFV